ncbi:MAG: hypothetical protein M4579_004749 [Chaenotheca gracillima]|nr:MAG: hypothetical protein M4579_004749 [Chaenotheca gracillima]
MPKNNEVLLSAMLGAESDEDANMNGDDPASDTSIENIQPPKKTQGKRAASSTTTTTKPRAPARNMKAATAPETKKMTGSKRLPLQEQKNVPNASENEEVDAFEDGDEEDDMVDVRDQTAARGRKPKATNAQITAPPKRGRPAKSKPEEKPKPTVRGKKIQVATRFDEQSEEEQPEEPAKKPRPRKIAITKSSKAQVPVQPETHHFAPSETRRIATEVEDDEPENVDDEMDNVEIAPKARQVSRARSVSNVRQPSNPRKRGASASDTERGNGGGDPAVRRKLGEMTKRFQNLDLKYRNLREVGVKEAENNFERLRKQTQEQMEASKQLINSLRQEAASQASLARESRTLQKQVSSKDDEISKLQAKVAQLNSSLSEAKNETKGLAAKLAATRATPAPPQGPDAFRTSVNAAKARATPGASAELTQALQVAQLKEDLYSDLTGLIVRGVKSSEEADIYDCIQTGRNGTLQFKLSISKTASVNSKEKNASSVSSYEDAEVTFTPILDADRDSDLIELLPEYLTEEITFARDVVAKFYGRVAECLTKAS